VRASSRSAPICSEVNVAFLESIALEKTLPCLAEPGKIIVVGRPSRPLDDVMPYLASLPNVVAYNPRPPSLTLRRKPGLITLQPDRVSITQVTDMAEGMQLLASLADAINATWEHRAELVAVTARRQAPKPLDVWAFLPQTNCGLCGELTCMAFAFNLILGRRPVSECRILVQDNRFADRLSTLVTLLE
jgi:ArsR family metal-binding transcriptional regulator